MLESYSPERRGPHASLDEAQAKGFERLMYRNRVEDALLGAVGQAVPDVGSELFGSDDLQQISVSYPESPLSEDHFGLRRLLHPDVPEAGDRAPDANVTDAEGRTVTLFSSLYNPDGQSCDGPYARLGDRDGHAHSAFGLEGLPALVLVRPDGHVAFRGPAGEPERLRQYCDRVFGTAGR